MEQREQFDKRFHVRVAEDAEPVGSLLDALADVLTEPNDVEAAADAEARGRPTVAGLEGPC